jgi:hypothetical protein
MATLGAVEEVQAPPAKACASFRAVSQRDWAEIENVTVGVRRVGNMFALAAEELVLKKPKEETKDEWDLPLWLHLTGCKPLQGLKKESKAALMQAKLRLKHYQHLHARITDVKHGVARLESLGSSMEAYTYSALRWAKGQENLDAVVSLYRLRHYIASRFLGADSALESIDLLLKRPLCVSTLLTNAIDNEQILLCPTVSLPLDLAMYPEQRELALALLSWFAGDEAILMRYETPPSGGKTAATALLGAVLAHLRDEVGKQKGEKRLQDKFVLYTCYSAFVRTDVCKHLISASVPFALMNGCLGTPSYRCYHSGKPPKQAKPAPLGARESIEYLEALQAVRSPASGAGVRSGLCGDAAAKQELRRARLR